MNQGTPFRPGWSSECALIHLGSGGLVGLARTEARMGAKQRLVSALLDMLVPGGINQPGGSGMGPFTLENDRLGRPRLLVGERPGPAVSFTYADRHLWAAMAPGQGIGVDVALAREFKSPYPYHRVFSTVELDQVKEITSWDVVQGAALLWSLKEAAVKACGCGFHHCPPLEVTTDYLGWQDGWVAFQVKAEQVLPAWARPEGHGWLALAGLE